MELPIMLAMTIPNSATPFSIEPSLRLERCHMNSILIRTGSGEWVPPMGSA
jgi:hypothetical protein